MGHKICSNITCPNRQFYVKYWRRFSLVRNLVNIKKSRSLKIDVFEIPGNKNIWRLFSKYEVLFLDQANFSFDPFQILILRFFIRRASLPPSRSQSNFALANWNHSSKQSSSCSFLVSLFCPTPFNYTPPEVLDVANHMARQANQIYQGTKGLWSLVRNDTFLISPFFLKIWTVITGLTISDSLSLWLRKLVHCR